MKSLGILMGRGICNARCSGCAGVAHRAKAPQRDGEVDEDDIRSAIRLAAGEERSLKSISISGSGEPLLSPESVTKTLEIIQEEIRDGGITVGRVSLYTNGILLLQREAELTSWRRLGLEWVYVTRYHWDDSINGMTLGSRCYSSLSEAVWAVEEVGLLLRVNFVLRRGLVDTACDFIHGVEVMREYCDELAAWPMRGPNDTVGDEAPTREALDEMKTALEKCQAEYCGWDRNVKLYWPQGQEYSRGEKLTLFYKLPLSSSWCNT